MNMGSMLRNLHISPSSGFFLKIVGFTFIRGILKYCDIQDIQDNVKENVEDVFKVFLMSCGEHLLFITKVTLS